MAKKKIDKGAEVLIAKPHLHGLHATVLNAEDSNAVAVRVNEHGHEGQVFVFPSSDLVAVASKAQLKKHPNERLGWDRYESKELDIEPLAGSDAKGSNEGDD